MIEEMKRDWPIAGLMLLVVGIFIMTGLIVILDGRKQERMETQCMELCNPAGYIYTDNSCTCIKEVSK